MTTQTTAHVADSTSLKAALAEARETAQQARRKAMSAAQACEESIGEAEATVRAGLDRVADSRGGSAEAIAELQKQLNSIMGEVRRDYAERLAELERLGERMQDFSISLFGRTGAGKSTLMEILTDGDGSSIGHGGQRTTRDVRGYRWKGLHVTDVPGVAAFDGEQDEELAYDAARSADMVVFLFTDDAPQIVEAEHIARVLRLGKPVLGLCNVKQTLERERDVRRFLRRGRKKLFSRRQLRARYEQFEELVKQFIEQVDIDFHAVHLRARYLANLPKYAEWQNDLLEASRVEVVERKIIDEVQNRGKLLRVRTFIDGAAVPLLDLNDRLLEFSAQNSAQGRLIVGKRNQLESWQKKFGQTSIDEISDGVRGWIDQLRDQIPSFVQDNVEREDIEERWKKKVKRVGIERKAEKLQQNLMERCRARLEEFGSELEVELDLVSQSCQSASLSGEKIHDYKRGVEWVGVIVGLTSATLALFGSGGIAALPYAIMAGVPLVAQIFSIFFTSREEKLKKARRTLTNDLQSQLDKNQRELKTRIKQWFRTELDQKVIEGFKSNLDVAVSGLFKVADGQRALADELAEEVRGLNEYLLDETLKHIGQPSTGASILKIARVPGAVTMLLIPPGTQIPSPVREILSAVLDTPIWLVIDRNDPKSVIRQVVGQDCKRRMRLDDKAGIAYIHLRRNTPATRDSVRIAQQLTDVHIVQQS
jgi:GTPase Era involved in 16S rRNA processing